MNEENELTIHSIEGIDVHRGLGIVGGRQRSYQKILRAFYREGSRKIDDILAAYEEKDATLYTTYVHGTKSASSNIGANDLSQICVLLEAAGISNDWNTINLYNDMLIEEYRKIVKNIGEVLGEEAAGTSFDKDTFIAVLKELRKSFDEFDIASIKKGCEALEKYVNCALLLTADRALITVILQNKVIGEYDEAIVGIDKILASIK